MNDLDQARQLENTLASMFALNNNANSFRRYWNLYKQTSDIARIQSFYIKTEESYYNVAIIGDGILVDVEGDDSDSSGGLNIRSLDAIRGVTVRSGPLKAFPRTQGASLVVLTRLVGETNAGPYWVAKTPEEEGRLLGFAQSLVQAFSSK